MTSSVNGTTASAGLVNTDYNTNTPGNVGGTAGNDSTSGGSNVLSMNLGGVNVNYDLGPSTDAVAAQAYSFLDNSFDSDSALVGNTIIGSQNFLTALAQPAEGAITEQQNFNDETLPSMFQSLSDQNYSLGQAAVGAESQEAQASIASSNAQASEANKNSGGGGLCFITTAACEVIGEADRGPTLTTLRNFRDHYMQDTDVRRALVNLYYQIAPRMLENLRNSGLSTKVLNFAYFAFLRPACYAIEHGDEAKAFAIYRLMLLYVGRVSGVFQNG